MSVEAATKNDEGQFDIDDVSSELGFGKFQMLNVSFTCLAIFLSIFSGQSFVFTARDAPYRCMVPECENNTAEYVAEYLSKVIPRIDGVTDKCRRFSRTPDSNSSSVPAEPCNEWVYEEPDTLVEDFNIPCQEWKLTLVGSANGVAHIFNYFISGILSDRYGRKTVMIVSAAAASVVGVIQAFSYNYWTFIFLEFLNMVVSSGSYACAYILGVELLPKERRLLGSALLNAACGFGNSFLGLVAWQIPQWKNLLFATNIPSLLMLIAVFAIPESYLWLYSQGRYVECVDVINKAAKCNNVSLSEKSQKFLEKLEIDATKKMTLENEHGNVEGTPGLWELWKSKCLMVRLGINCIVWFVALFVYDGLTINSVSLAANDNIYLNYSLVSLIEIPGHLIFLVVLDRLGRKMSLISSFTISGVVLMLYAFIPTSKTVVLFLVYMIGKFIVTVASDIVYIYTSELFPTGMRNSSLNICALFGALGISVAPQMPLLLSVSKELPMIVFGCAPLIAALCALKLPETVNARLPETIEEAENIVNAKSNREKNTRL